MTWTEAIPTVIGIGYACTAVGYACRGEWGWAIAYFGYAIGNVGLVWAAIAGRH